MRRYIKGRETILYIKYNDFWCPISCETSSPITEDVEMLDVTTRDNPNGWKTSMPTLQSYTIEFNGQTIYEGGENTLSYYRLRELKRTRTLVEWRRVTIDGGYLDHGKAYVSNISDSNEVEGFQTFSATVVVYGEPTYSQDVIPGGNTDPGTDWIYGVGGFIDISQND